jgi:hypothetical protein
MTRDEIMAMDGQELCNWLEQKGVITKKGFNHIIGMWVFPACAFAARDHVCSTESGGIMWLSREHDIANYKRAWEDQPLDWLRAAAIVAAEQGAGK